MANHAYVFGCKKKFNEDTIIQLANNFNKTVLKGLFQVNKNKDDKETYLSFQYGNDYNMHLGFWISKYKRSKRIEIRHGHCGDFMWWVDHNWQNYLAWHLKGKMRDDGHDQVWEAKEEIKYPLIVEWAKSRFPSRIAKMISRFMLWEELKPRKELLKAFWRGKVPKMPKFILVN